MERALSIYIPRFLIMLIVLICSCAPKPNEPYNVHIWELPNREIVTYYEISEGKGAFTANLLQYVVIQKSGLKKKISYWYWRKL